MSGVTASWVGKCRNHQTQKILIDDLLMIAEDSIELILDHEKLQAKIIHFPFESKNKQLLISKMLLGGSYRPDEKLIVPCVFKNIIPGEYDGYTDNTFPLENNIPPKYYHPFFRLDDISLYGINFPVFDPKRSIGIISNYERMTFAFIRSNNKQLDGLMVKVSKFCNSLDANSNKYLWLLPPDFDIHYYLEYWMMDLLAWIKKFYLTKMKYWIWTDNINYKRLKLYKRKDTITKDQILEQLRNRYRQEAQDLHKTLKAGI